MIEYCTDPKSCKHFAKDGSLIMPPDIKPAKVKDYMHEMMQIHERDTLIVTLPIDRKRWADVRGSVGKSYF
jgi:hypothetical protein